MDHCLCLLCNKTREQSRFICSTCVNTGRFSLSKHELCTSRRYEQLISLLNKNDSKEFKEYIEEKDAHQTEIQCFYAMFVLKKYRLEKESLQNQFQLKWKPFFQMNLMIEKYVVQQKRIIQARQQAFILREQIKKKKQLNLSTSNHIKAIRSRNRDIKQKIVSIKDIVNERIFGENGLPKMLKDLHNEQNKVRHLRREYLYQLQNYICPIELVSTLHGDIAERIIRLRDIWNDDDDDGDINEIQLNNNVASVELKSKKYRIGNSFLSIKDDNAINNLVTIYNSAGDVEEPNEATMGSIVLIGDIDSPRLLPSAESFETLSALSYACLLTNAIAQILDVPIPFYMHQIEFHKSRLTFESLRTNVAKLNANIVRICRSQNILVDGKERCTLENLHNILQLSSYPSTQPDIDIFSPTFLPYLETVVTDVDDALNTKYWFDHIVVEEENTNDIDYMQSDSNSKTNLTTTNSDPSQTSEMSNSTGSTANDTGFMRSWFGWRS